MTFHLSVVMPAHDEASIIGERLRELLDSDPEQRLELVVVANGCHDDTAAIAAAVSPRVRVVEIPQASKIAALNAGDRAAITFPRAYVDADVRVTAAALLAVAARLDGRPGQVGAPTLVVDASSASAPVRRYYRIWEHSEYRLTGHIGSGVYVLSAAARARFGEFPEIIADDRFVQQLFPPVQRVTVAEQTFTVPAPRTFRALVKRGIRIASGNLQIADAYPDLAAGSAGSRFGPLVKRIAVRPSLWFAFATYCYGYAVPRIAARVLKARGRIPTWNRDETNRVAAA